jgi:two-component system, chemotaxis family, protein-glutamate methylesterase/glutaminase
VVRAVEDIVMTMLTPESVESNRQRAQTQGETGIPSRVVAIGTSAGGLAALRAILTTIPPEFPAPIVIVQHLAPSPPGLLSAILASHAHIPVVEAADGDTLVRGRAYVAPAGLHMTIDGARIVLTVGEKVAHSRPSIDVLFESVARTWGTRAIAALLTGMGRDGTAGLAAIRARGGTTIVQDPADAAFASMPAAAVAHNGHIVLPLATIGDALLDLAACKGITASTGAAPRWTWTRSSTVRHDPIDPAQFGGIWQETSPWPQAGTRVADYRRRTSVSSEWEPLACETAVTPDRDVVEAMRMMRGRRAR